MKRCPITYELIPDTEQYSKKGLHMLSPQLENLHPLQLTADEQRHKALENVEKMSIQGFQRKLSAQLKASKEAFEIVERDGRFILKPQSSDFAELPENEAITMTLASYIGIEVPLHGMVYSRDGSLTYFIKRFDRQGYKKYATEDFAQLLGLSRYTKYNASMEKVITVVENYCTYPKIELVKLFKFILFNFLVGNEDMHLKNFSLITRDEVTTMSPAYDLLNSFIVLKNAKEEMALQLHGKKSNLKKADLIDYMGIERMGLNKNVIDDVLDEIRSVVPRWHELMNISFLSDKMREKYLLLLDQRCKRLDLDD